MQWSDISFRPSNRMLRQFALGWIVIFGGLACWQEFSHENHLAAFICAALALVLGGGGLVHPPLLRYLFIVCTCLTFPIGWVISQALLIVLLYGVFTPIALCFRLIGRDVLNRRHPSTADSYWQPKPAAKDVRAYFRQS